MKKGEESKLRLRNIFLQHLRSRIENEVNSGGDLCFRNMSFLQFALLRGSSFCRNPGPLTDQELWHAPAFLHSANAATIRGGLHCMKEQVLLLQEAGWKLMPRGSQSLWEDFLVHLALNVPWKSLGWFNKLHLSVFPWRVSVLAEKATCKRNRFC